MDLNSLQQKINSYTSVVSSWLKNSSKLYISNTPAVVKVKMLDEHGKVVDVNVPNIAKVKADFDAKKRFTHSMGIGTDATSNLNNGKGLALGDGDTGFRQNGDGQLEMFANNQRIAKIYPNGLYVWKEHYYENWIRNNGTGASGMYWHNSKNPGFGWHLYPQNRADMTLTTGSGNGGIKGTIGNVTARGYIHWTTNNDIGFLNKDRKWSLRTDVLKRTFFYNEAYVKGAKVNHTSNTKFHSGTVKAVGGYGFITPPSGYVIGNLKAVIVANNITYSSGNVDGNDILICRVRSNNDAGRIKVECRNSEQRGDAWFNFLTVWQK